MKTIYTVLVWCLFGSLFFSFFHKRASDQTPFLKTDATILNLGSKINNIDSFNIIANVGWTVSVSKSATKWLGISTVTGTNNGKIMVRALQVNNTNVAKIGTITISPVNDSSLKPITISVNQKPAGEIVWSKVIGGSGYDNFKSVIKTLDGGYIAVGCTSSADCDITSNQGKYDILVVKFKEDGGIQWIKTYGGSNLHAANSIVATSDGYAIVGSKSFDSYTNIFILKLSFDGTEQWLKTYGGSDNDGTNSVVATSIVAISEGYAVAGYSFISSYCDIVSSHGDRNIFILKLNLDGEKQWVKSYGGCGDDAASSIIATSDGYAITGSTDSKDGDIKFNQGGDDIFILKLGWDGSKQWLQTYGGCGDDAASSIIATSDGYAITGYTDSKDGDIISNHRVDDIFIMKLNLNGKKQWLKTYGGSSIDKAHSLLATSDGYIIAGETYSTNEDIKSNHGEGDMVIMKLNLDGEKQWLKIYGGSRFDRANSISSASDGYVVAGETRSNNGDVSGNHGAGDAWLLKIKE